MRDNVNAPVLVDFTRNTAETGSPSGAAPWAFMQSSTIDISAGAELDGYAWDNPQFDPATGVELGNRLIVNGVEQPHGRFIPYSPQR